mmetsp:Transcript_24549/g.60332  ORF Transcript_24549/g.60332 Transcript_24549/m.60332 type:complete len:293 (-) Transcript_24549:356-1234(-)
MVQGAGGRPGPVVVQRRGAGVAHREGGVRGSTRGGGHGDAVGAQRAVRAHRVALGRLHLLRLRGGERRARRVVRGALRPLHLNRRPRLEVGAGDLLLQVLQRDAPRCRGRHLALHALPHHLQRRHILAQLAGHQRLDVAVVLLAAVRHELAVHHAAPLERGVPHAVHRPPHLQWVFVGLFVDGDEEPAEDVAHRHEARPVVAQAHGPLALPVALVDGHRHVQVAQRLQPPPVLVAALHGQVPDGLVARVRQPRLDVAPQRLLVLPLLQRPRVGLLRQLYVQAPARQLHLGRL